MCAVGRRNGFTGYRCALAVAVAVICGQRLRAQAITKDVGRTTLSGVYTTVQAERGKNIYAGMCRSCHTPQSHTGVVFEHLWANKPLSELYVFVSDRMPKNDPGGMSPREYADVIAYLLKMNAMPAGKTELPADSSQLDTIRIAMKKKSRPITRD